MTGKITPVLHILAIMALAWVLVWGALTLAGLAGRAVGYADAAEQTATE